MRYKKLLLPLAVLYLVSSTGLKAADAGYTSCPSGQAFVYLYQSLTTFEVLARLKCGEKVEIVDPGNNTRVRVRTLDGKEGYLPQSDISATPPSTQQATSGSAGVDEKRDASLQPVSQVSQGPCVILKRMGPADQITSHMYSFGIRGKQFQYVEGEMPARATFHGRLTDHDVRNIQAHGGRVVIMEPKYSPDDLKEAKQSCKNQ